MNLFLWGVYPYLALMIMIVGSFYRYVHRPKTWTAKSSEILEKRWLRWGSMLFHWGLFFVFGGHVIGLLVPWRVFAALGITEQFYHLNADIVGGLAGAMTWIGLLILLIRRVVHVRVRRNSDVGDFIALLLVFFAVTLGDLVTLGYNQFVGPFDYMHTVSPWIRSVLLLHPQAYLMNTVPLVFKLHIIIAFALFAVVPFTRLVHFFSIPLRYVGRSPIQYRSRTEYK